ncbi:hypothetical protein [Metabacillus fastidiosus]|uniref:hypothetical protein n=1 Tax=Metabacillus fastidiosus TaxID=1458 RepID=UPI003D2B84B4
MAANQIMLDIENETYVQEKDILFKDFILDYLQLIAKPAVRPSTFNGYTKAVEKRLIGKFSHMKIKSFTPIMISKYYNELIEEGLTEEYIQYLYSILKMAAQTAVNWKYL